MSTQLVKTSINVYEDTQNTFEIRDLLKKAGVNSTSDLTITSISVTLPDGSKSSVNTGLFGMVDKDTVYVRPGEWAKDWFGKFTTLDLVVEDRAGGTAVNLGLTVNVDPVNDAPVAADKVFDLVNGAAVVLTRADFSFVDPVEKNDFKSVIITKLPSAGQLMLNGVAVTADTEISVAEIDAGNLTFVPSQTQAGSFNVDFKVRDTGGTVGTGAADTSLVANHLTFNVPKAHLGDFVWEDSNGNGVQDSGEAGLADVVVQLKDGAGNVVASTTTDATGTYHFDVNPGTYSVTVQAPNGYLATGKAQGGNDALDSDIDAQGNSAVITLAPGETSNKADAGLVRPVSLGSTVW